MLSGRYVETIYYYDLYVLVVMVFSYERINDNNNYQNVIDRDLLAMTLAMFAGPRRSDGYKRVESQNEETRPAVFIGLHELCPDVFLLSYTN